MFGKLKKILDFFDFPQPQKEEVDVNPFDEWCVIKCLLQFVKSDSSSLASVMLLNKLWHQETLKVLPDLSIWEKHCVRVCLLSFKDGQNTQNTRRLGQYVNTTPTGAQIYFDMHPTGDFSFTLHFRSVLSHFIYSTQIKVDEYVYEKLYICEKFYEFRVLPATLSNDHQQHFLLLVHLKECLLLCDVTNLSRIDYRFSIQPKNTIKSKSIASEYDTLHTNFPFLFNYTYLSRLVHFRPSYVGSESVFTVYPHKNLLHVGILCGQVLQQTTLKCHQTIIDYKIFHDQHIIFLCNDCIEIHQMIVNESTFLFKIYKDQGMHQLKSLKKFCFAQHSECNKHFAFLKISSRNYLLIDFVKRSFTLTQIDKDVESVSVSRIDINQVLIFKARYGSKIATKEILLI